LPYLYLIALSRAATERRRDRQAACCRRRSALSAAVPYPGLVSASASPWITSAGRPRSGKATGTGSAGRKLAAGEIPAEPARLPCFHHRQMGPAASAGPASQPLDTRRGKQSWVAVAVRVRFISKKNLEPAAIMLF
jgi:hypothetical protein